MASKRHDKVTRTGVRMVLRLTYADEAGALTTESAIYRGRAVGLPELYERCRIPKRRLVDVAIMKMDTVLYGIPEDDFFRIAEIIEK